MKLICAALVWCLLVTIAFGVDARPTVTIYPTGPTVPENLLRIELRFSTPLSDALRIDQVRLLGANGEEIDQPFLDLMLPSFNGKRVTILLHPARLKSGLGANLVLVRALHVGSTVTLVVEHPELGAPMRKTWTVTEFDAESPWPGRWTFATPRRGSRMPLVLQLHNPISSSAETLIAIRAPDGGRVAGRMSLQAGETIWRFTPMQPWRVGNYAVVVHPDLEDPAGNRPCALFEMADVSPIGCKEEVVLPFAPSPPSAISNRLRLHGQAF